MLRDEIVQIFVALDNLRLGASMETFSANKSSFKKRGFFELIADRGQKLMKYFNSMVLNMRKKTFSSIQFKFFKLAN